MTSHRSFLRFILTGLLGLIVFLPFARATTQVVDTSIEKSSGFTNGTFAPFYTCTTYPGNAGVATNLNGQPCVRFTWHQAGYNGTRVGRGTEGCSTLEVQKECWFGFYVYIPSPGYPTNKEAGIAQWFANNSACSSWAAMLVLRNNDLIISHRTGCVPYVDGVVYANFPRNRWVSVITHSVVSRTNAGKFEIFIDGVSRYNATNINYGYDSWTADDALQSPNHIGLKIGQYAYDDANYDTNEVRSIYYTNVTQISGNPAGVFDYIRLPAAAPTQAPLTPANLQATGVTSRRIDLSWEAPVGAASFTIRRATTSGGPYTTLATGVTGITYSDTGLNPSTTYHYVVAASNQAGSSADSAQATGNTLAPTVPDAPTKLMAVAGSGRANITWVTSLGADTYTLKRATVSGGPYLPVTTTALLEFNDSPLTNGTAYYYVVSATNSFGEGANSPEVSVAPASGALTYWPFNETSGTTATDVWSGANATLSTDATWASGAITNGVRLNGTTTSYVDVPAGIVDGVTDFTISAWVNISTAANWSRLFDFGTDGTNYMMLSPRSGATGNGVRYAIRTPAVAERQISGPVLPFGKWTHLAVTQTGTTGILYINGIEAGRNTAMTLNPASLGSTTLNKLGVSKFPANPNFGGTVDDFRIYGRALSATEIYTVVTTVAPGRPTGLSVVGNPGNVQLSWTGSPSAAAYNVKRGTVSGGPYSLVAASVTTTSYTDTTAIGGVYYYVVTAETGVFESAASEQASIQLPPSGLVASGWNARTDLSWLAMTGATSYSVKRSTAASGPFVTVGTTTTSTTYSDPGLTNGTRYYYAIAAVTSAGEGPIGTIVSATPASGPLVDDWTHGDIGTVGATGNAGHAAGLHTVHGAGADIWGTADAFHYHSTTLTGNGAIVARVMSLQNTNLSAKAGVMMRASLAANSQHASVFLKPDNNVEAVRRATAGATSTAQRTADLAPPRWIRLVRAGNAFTTFHSADGITWVAVGTSQNITMGATIQVGLAVSSRDIALPSRAEFESVNIATAAPVIGGTLTAAGTTGVPLSYAIQSTNTPYLYTASPLPPGLTLNARTGVISGVPAVSGAYDITLTAVNAMGSATANLTITVAKGTATIVLDSLTQSYDGTAKSATATTSPVGLNVTFTYDGSATPPANAGTYAVAATIADANYDGSAAGALTIAKAPAAVTLGNLTATYNGAAKIATAATNPAGLSTALTYDGSSTAPIAAGSYAVAATIVDNNYTGSAAGTLTIAKAPATVTLGNLSVAYDGTAKTATATTSPGGLAVTLTYNGSATAPSAVGSYAVAAMVVDPNYTGTATGTFVIATANATVALGNLAATYDGSAKSASATTSPAGLSTTLTYDGSTTAPTAAGSYAVVATINDASYIGSATGTLVIAKASATITLGNLAATYDGTAKVATATTDPADLSSSFTYDGSATAPSAVGSYTVAATVTDANYTGTATGTLVIAKATATITLGNLAATYDGTPKLATATTAPAGLAVTFTYDGLPLAINAPSGALTSYAAAIGQTLYVNVTGSISGTVYGANSSAYAINSDVATAAVHAGIVTPGQTTVLQISLLADAGTYASSTQNGVTSLSAAASGGAFQIVGIASSGFTTGPIAAGSYAVTGTILDASYTGSAAGTLTIAKATPALTWTSPASIAYGTPLGTTQLNASASSAGAFTYTPAAGTILNVGANQTLSVAFAPSDTANFNTATTTTTITVTPATATVALSNLSQTYNGTARVVIATTSPAGLSVSLTYNSITTAPTAAGSYAVVAAVTDANYSGSVSGTLTVARAPVAITLNGLTATYDGAAKSVIATTSPTGLPVTITYNGSTTAPTNAGTYSVAGSVSTPNYVGAASGTLAIGKAIVTMTLAPLGQLYDGTPRTVTATTSVAGLTVDILYDDLLAAPTYPGVFTVRGTINNANYQGSATATLKVGTTVLVRHAPTINAMVVGSVQVLLPENMSLNSSSTISSDLLVPGTPTVQLNSDPTYAGTVNAAGVVTPSNYTITLNRGSVLRHVVRRIDARAMPVVAAPPTPTGSRTVTINATGQTAGDFATLRDLTLNAGVNVLVPPGTYGAFVANGSGNLTLGVTGATEPSVYNLQSLTLNGTGTLSFVGPVVLTVNGDVTINNTSAGQASTPAWLDLRLATGGLTLNGTAHFHGSVTAPAGTVNINGSSTLTGSVVSDQLTINSTALLSDPDTAPPTPRGPGSTVGTNPPTVPGNPAPPSGNSGEGAGGGGAHSMIYLIAFAFLMLCRGHLRARHKHLG